MKTNKAPPLPFKGLKVVLGPFDLRSENWHWSRPIPNCFNLWVALEGQAEMTTLGKTYPIHPGVCFVFSPHQELSARSVSPQPFRNFACRFLPVDGNGDILRENVGSLMGVESSNFLGCGIFARRPFNRPALRTPSPHNKRPASVIKSSPKFGGMPTRLWPRIPMS